MSSEGTFRWFGEPWDAPACEPDTRIPTPVGMSCDECHVLIEYDSQGVRIPGTDGYVAYHLRCFFNLIGVP